MSYDLLQSLGLSWSEALSAVALALSGCAFLTARHLSTEATRKVDGMLGELPPNLALYPAAGSTREGVEILHLQIDNHNRRPVRLTGLQLDESTKLGLVAYQLVGSREILLGDVERPHNLVATSLVVEGTPPGASDFNSARLKLVVTGKLPAPKRKKPVTLSVRVEFELLKDVPEKRSEIVSLELRAPASRKSPAFAGIGRAAAAA
jgi:hypothetical protein